MSTNIGSAWMSVLPTAKGFGAALSKDINPQLAAAGKSSGISFGKYLGAAAVGGFVAAGLSKIIHTGISETLDASAGAAQLAAGIKSTGNAANVSVKGMEALASSIQNYSGQTDDSIVAAEALLQTFTKIKNNGPDKIFDQATVAAANMAAKFGGDAASQALVLGKALNDPVNMLGALTRNGVTFTQGQKDSIKAMVEMGNMAGAQKIILKELAVETGGAAKAFGDSLAGGAEKAKRAFEDASQAMVEKLLPVILPAFTSIATAVTTKVIPAMSDFVDGFIKGTNTAGKLKDKIIAVYSDAFKPFVDFLINNRDKVALFVGTIGGGILIFKGITAAVKVTTATMALYRGIMTLVMLANGGVAASSSLVVGGLVAIRTAIFSIPIVGWAAAAITAFALLYIKFAGFRNVVAIVANEIIRWFQGIANVGIGMVNVLIKAWNFVPWHKDIKLLANVELPHLATAAENAAKRIAAASYAHPTRGPIKGSGVKTTSTGGGSTGDTIGGGIVDSSKLLDAINLKIAVEDQKKTLKDFTRYLSSDFISSIKDSGTKAADVISKLVSGVDGLAKGFAATISDPVKQGAFNLASTKIVNALETKLLGFQSAFDAIQTAREALKTNIADADSALKDAIKLRTDAAGSIADLLSKPFGQPSELVKQLSGAEATGESIISGYDSMVKMVTDRFASIKGDKKDSLLAFLKDSTTQLLGLAKDRADTAKLLDKAQTDLEDAIKTKSAYADGLSSGLKSAALSLSEFIDKETGAASPAGIIAGFKARLGVIKNFSSNLKSLASRGLNQNLLDQIIGMGTVDGGALAASLTTAGSDQIDALNQTGVEIAATADSLGAALSDKFYGQSVANAQSIVKGYTDSQEMINAAMRSITSGIALEMSPLTNVMASFGEDSALALLNGFKSQDNALIAQAASLGARMAQAIADALSLLRVASGGGDFGVAAAKAASAKLTADAQAAQAAADAKAKAKADADALLKKTETSQFNGATTDDIMNLGKLIIKSNKDTALLTQQLQRTTPRGAVL